MGCLINRKTRELSQEDIRKIADTYHRLRYSPSPNLSQGERDKNSLPLGEMSEGQRGYKDIKGFCNSASVERVKELDYVLTPGRYVGLPDVEDDFDFNERFTTLKAEFEVQLIEETKLNDLIKENLARIELKN
jgi:type I restriction enzyme M protein